MTMWIENAVENDEADVEQRNHVNLQVTDSVGGSKPCKIFHLGAMHSVPSAGTCLFLSQAVSMVSRLDICISPNQYDSQCFLK